MSTKTTAICDMCGLELVLKTSGPLSDADYAREIAMEGWWQRDDAFRDICPNHPRPS